MDEANRGNLHGQDLNAGRKISDKRVRDKFKERKRQKIDLHLLPSRREAAGIARREAKRA